MTDESTNTKDEDYNLLELCLRHSKADRSLRLIIARELEPFNLTMMEWLLIGIVEGSGKQGASMSYVAGKLDVTLPQVTALSINLTKTKLLKQKISHRDRRSRKLQCTPVAKRVYLDGQGVINKRLESLFSGISRQELGAYFGVLKMISDSKPPGAGAKQSSD